MKGVFRLLIAAILSTSFINLGFAQDKTPEKLYGFVLSLGDITELAITNNFDIQLAKFDYYINEQDLFEELSKYDTELAASVKYINDQRKPANIIVGEKSLNNEYSLGISKLLPTGTTIGLDFTLDREWSDSGFVTSNPYYESSAKVSIVQQLGKNFFGMKDRGEVKITKLDISNSGFTSLDRIERAIADAQIDYWRVVYRYTAVKLRKDILERAEWLYEMDQKRLSRGTIERPEFLYSEANVIERKTAVLVAENELQNAINDLKYSLNILDVKTEIIPLDQLDIFGYEVDFNMSMRQAIEHRRDYKRDLNNIKSRNINLSIKENNLWPEINLEASLVRNGIDRASKNATDQIYNQDNPEYSFGVTVVFPLENREAKAQFEQSKLEKAKALVNLKKTEEKILVEIDQRVRECNVTRKQSVMMLEAAKLQDEKLKGQEIRFKYGRSDSDTLIRYQHHLLFAQLDAAKSMMDYKVALIELDVAQNTFLDRIWKDPL